MHITTICYFWIISIILCSIKFVCIEAKFIRKLYKKRGEYDTHFFITMGLLVLSGAAAGAMVGFILLGPWGLLCFLLGVAVSLGGSILFVHVIKLCIEEFVWRLALLEQHKGSRRIRWERVEECPDLLA